MTKYFKKEEFEEWLNHPITKVIKNSIIYLYKYHLNYLLNLSSSKSDNPSYDLIKISGALAVYKTLLETNVEWLNNSEAQEQENIKNETESENT